MRGCRCIHTTRPAGAARYTAQAELNTHTHTHTHIPLVLPQLLLACVALLNSSVVRVVELAMHLMLQVGIYNQHCWRAGLGVVLFWRVVALAMHLMLQVGMPPALLEGRGGCRVVLAVCRTGLRLWQQQGLSERPQDASHLQIVAHE